MPQRQGPVVLSRRLAGGQAMDGAWLDTVRWNEGAVSHFRLIGRVGRLDAGAIAAGDGTRIDEMREVGGALMVCGVTAGGPVRLSLAGTGAPVDPATADTAVLAGRDCIVAMRGAESADTICDWLAWHIQHHGVTGAVIVNRAAPPHDRFLNALEAALRADGRFRDRDLTVILLDPGVALGKPGVGPESHPFLCPDAPGKDRMAMPPPDPWLAPLGEPLIYEALKWRFLAQARAVVALDCCDLLCPRPASAANVFDLCENAIDGVVLLAGRRVYPWRVRPGHAVTFADHVCRVFDARRGIARWGVAPARAGLVRTWRPLRIAYARPDAGGILPFWRAMAIRAPGWKPAQLAPKSALVEDEALVAMATGHFGASPARPPRPATASRPDRTVQGQRTCIITTMKNEGPFILEWLAHHRAIGVEEFLIYSNDCTDGTDRLLDVLQSKGLVQHRANSYRATPGVRPQHAALEAAESEAVVRECDWAICMDVDEFVDIRLGDGTLPELFDAMGGANMISLTWRMFGNADIVAFQDRFITEQFTLAAPELVRKPHQAWGFKTLFRTIDTYKKLGVHRPKGLRPELWTEVKWLNGSGKAMPQRLFRNGWRSSLDSYGYDWVSLNHYACRSVESFLVKRDRGRVNHTDRDQGLAYWFRMNHNAVEERSFQRHLPRLGAEWSRLMADPEIAAAHQACVAAHRSRIEQLLDIAEYRAMHATLSGERMQRLSRLLRHFGAAVFNAGPSAIPPDLHKGELPGDFFFTVDYRGHARH